MLFVSGIIFLIGAFIMKKLPPKKVNMWYGYRTSLSMSSEKAWHLSQKHSIKAMIKYSLIMMIVGLFTGFYFITENHVAIILIIELLVLLPLFTVLMLLSTHNYLKRMLNKE